MRKSLRFLSFILFVSVVFYSMPLSASHPLCNCGQDRVLKMTDPIMEGKDVRDIQAQLQNLGYHIESVTGKYDKNTTEAVKSFQKTEGLVADGIFGPKSLKRLSELYLEGCGGDLLPSGGPKGTVFVSEGEISLAIDSLGRTLTVLIDGSPYKSFPVAVGKFSSPTPIGLFTVVHKDAWGEGFGSRWMQISVPWGTYGIHGTNKPWSIGAFESGGCIRMHNTHVEEVYDWVGIGTKVFIFGGVDGPFTFGLNPLTQGSKGSDVIEVQKRLEGLGFYSGEINGLYSYDVRAAVMAFQKEKGIDASGNVDGKTYEALGIILFQ